MPEIQAPTVSPTSSLTQHQKIVSLMCKESDKQWWLPQDFMGMHSGEFFVGYEASARLSELARRYPEMIESRRSGKYMERRIKFESINEWLSDVAGDIRLVIDRHYKG